MSNIKQKSCQKEGSKKYKIDKNSTRIRGGGILNIKLSKKNKLLSKSINSWIINLDWYQYTLYIKRFIYTQLFKSFSYFVSKNNLSI